MLNNKIDIIEEDIKEFSPQILEILLKDRTSKRILFGILIIIQLMALVLETK